MPLHEMTVRRAVPGDEPALRELRIQALTDAPHAFGSTLQRELDRTQAEWSSWLSPSATFLLQAGSTPSGLAAGVPDAKDPTIAWLRAMWVHPDLRGSGAAQLLVEHVVSWAATGGALTIRLDVVAGNDAAIRFYERLGFRRTGHTAVRERDGAIEIQMERFLGSEASDRHADGAI